MTSRERVVRTLTHQEVDRPPRDLWSLPGVSMFRGDELERMNARFPSDFAGPGAGYKPSRAPAACQTPPAATPTSGARAGR